MQQLAAAAARSDCRSVATAASRSLCPSHFPFLAVLWQDQGPRLGCRAKQRSHDGQRERGAGRPRRCGDDVRRRRAGRQFGLQRRRRLDRILVLPGRGRRGRRVAARAPARRPPSKPLPTLSSSRARRRAGRDPQPAPATAPSLCPSDMPSDMSPFHFERAFPCASSVPVRPSFLSFPARLCESLQVPTNPACLQEAKPPLSPQRRAAPGAPRHRPAARRAARAAPRGSPRAGPAAGRRRGRRARARARPGCRARARRAGARAG